MRYEIIEHQDFYEVIQGADSVLVADRHDNALTFLQAAVTALNEADGPNADDEDHAPRCIFSGQHRNDGRGMCIDCDYLIGAA